ncbi:hypothetical protein [Longimicrobium sp.]|uniref:hypothetical protein n=1 Tax=Longimicrobium sp. TaxID=2029185 RepID=UPI002CA36747|nr:hypothetical protein [Longimicrobium sp.]HSU12955.1 hypothetical protein [Longimicrobium sp.]
MTKLRLMLDELDVVSFPLSETRGTAMGTVHANEVSFNGCSNYCNTGVDGTSCNTQQQPCIVYTK